VCVSARTRVRGGGRAAWAVSGGQRVCRVMYGPGVFNIFIILLGGGGGGGEEVITDHNHILSQRQGPQGTDTQTDRDAKRNTNSKTIRQPLFTLRCVEKTRLAFCSIELHQ
jgi:hypothetical protein